MRFGCSEYIHVGLYKCGSDSLRHYVIDSIRCIEITNKESANWLVLSVFASSSLQALKTCLIFKGKESS